MRGASTNDFAADEETTGEQLKLNNNKINMERDEDGEYQNTRGLDNQMLLQQQRNMLDN